MGDHKSTSKLGRKGDPRMHRAVAARLANPEVSLFDALRIGGFDYPTNDDSSVMDSERVTLGQRKNQLSRRLRLARKNKGGGSDFEMGSGKDSPVTSVAADAPSLSPEAQKELQKFMNPSQRSKRSSNGDLGARALEMKNEYSVLEGDLEPEFQNPNALEEAQQKRQRVAKFHPDYSPLFVPPSKSMRSGGTPAIPPTGLQPHNQNPNAVLQGYSASHNSINTPGLVRGASGSGFQSGLLPSQGGSAFHTQQSQAPRASSVAVSSLTSSAQSVGMTLEQFAVALSSNPTGLAKLVAESSGEDAQIKQQELALNHYNNEIENLYSKSMLLAGIDPRLCQPSNPAYLQFAFKAWQAEGHRLHSLMGSAREIGEPPLDSKSTTDRDNVPNDDGEEHIHHHSDDKDDGHSSLCDAPHVHRLDGQCGHKAIIHQPKDGTTHIDFVVGNKVECYHGIEPLGASLNHIWPSKYKCSETEGNAEKCVKNNPATIPEELVIKLDSIIKTGVEPKIIELKDINLQDEEWNYDISGSIDGSLAGLFKLGERSDDQITV